MSTRFLLRRQVIIYFQPHAIFYMNNVQVAPCNYTGACQGAPCVYDFSRQGKNEDLFTVGADSDGANQFIGDIYESFRFQLFSNLQAYPLFAATTTLIMPYLQVRNRVCGYPDEWTNNAKLITGKVLLELPVRDQSDREFHHAGGLRPLSRPSCRGRGVHYFMPLGFWSLGVWRSVPHVLGGEVDGRHRRLCWAPRVRDFVPSSPGSTQRGIVYSCSGIILEACTSCL